MKGLLRKEISPPAYQEVEVELPHYWKHDHSGEDFESVSWGCIDEEGYTTISFSRFSNEFQWSLETEHREEEVKPDSTRVIGDQWACYWEDNHITDKETYDAAVQKCLAFVNDKLA